MSRRHFRKLAEMVYHLGKRNDMEKSAWLHLAGKLAEICRSENENFNTNKFYDACGITLKDRPV